jgi:hypothetical protein
LNPPAFSAAANACEMKGLTRRPRPPSRTRPSLTWRSSSLVMMFPKRNVRSWLKLHGIFRNAGCRVMANIARSHCSYDRPQPAERAEGCGFYPAIVRSVGLRSPVSPPNARQHAKSCEPRPNQSLRPPLRQSAHEERILTQSRSRRMRHELAGLLQSNRIRTVRIVVRGKTAELL